VSKTANQNLAASGFCSVEGIIPAIRPYTQLATVFQFAFFIEKLELVGRISSSKEGSRCLMQ
jgi:hypothetical protein